MNSLVDINGAVISYLQQFRPAPISEGDREVILASFGHHSYKENDYLFREGKVCSMLFFIYNGIVRIVSTNDKGVDRTHYFYKENQFCTILKSFREDVVAEASIQAASGLVESLTISKQRLNSLYAKLPYMKDVMSMLFQQQLVEKVETRNVYLGVDAETQYKLFLEKQPDIALRVSMKDIASYLGITPQSLSRIRRNIQ
ncbi:MAG: Crp/Fnr family transcriptional regulator [Bacteroidetes bacterium]|nr:Crp/Fnr family transcriptional regulator [Bacteroidota bacterium]